MKSLIALCLLLSSPAWAQSMKVIKVKGSQAIVNVTGGTVDVGQVIKVPAMGGEDDELELTASVTGPRKHVVGFFTLLEPASQYRTGKSDNGTVSNTSTVLDIGGRYGWNNGTTEYGALATFGMKDTGGGNNLTLGGGGFFDFNFVPNKAGNDMVYGIGIDGLYAITNLPNGGGSVNTMSFFPSGFLKWFVLKTPTAIRIDLGYQYAEASASGSKTKDQNVVLRAGFGVYF